jgi:hypothetical protein
LACVCSWPRKTVQNDFISDWTLFCGVGVCEFKEGKTGLGWGVFGILKYVFYWDQVAKTGFGHELLSFLFHFVHKNLSTCRHASLPHRPRKGRFVSLRLWCESYTWNFYNKNRSHSERFLLLENLLKCNFRTSLFQFSFKGFPTVTKYNSSLSVEWY